jgi:hypothetical protein
LLNDPGVANTHGTRGFRLREGPGIRQRRG